MVFQNVKAFSTFLFPVKGLKLQSFRNYEVINAKVNTILVLLAQTVSKFDE